MITYVSQTLDGDDLTSLEHIGGWSVTSVPRFSSVSKFYFFVVLLINGAEIVVVVMTRETRLNIVLQKCVNKSSSLTGATYPFDWKISVTFSEVTRDLEVVH